MSRLLTKAREVADEVRRDFAPDGTTPPMDARTTTIFVVSTVLLTLFHYYGKSDFYRAKLAQKFGPSLDATLGEFAGLAPYLYWGSTSIVMRVVVPALVIVFVFRERLSDWGFRISGQLRAAPAYLAMYFAMVPLLWWASAMESFQRRYPFYGPASEGGAQFWAFEFAYGLQFVGVEAFFRGFMTFGLFRVFGYHALLIMSVPYVMIHFNKPLPETLGALVAGCVLGFFALKSRSFWPGVALHWLIAITMDVFAIARAEGGLGAALSRIF